MQTQATVASATTAAASPGRTRLFFLDNFRIGLAMLVVLHHVAMNYGAGGPFYYVEPHPEGVSKTLLIFVLVNQAWFMGAFFLISGYLTPASFDRKGPRTFLSDRLVRLGIPLAVYTVVLNPIAMFGAFYWPEAWQPLTWDTYTYRDYVRMGPMWFVAMLLIMSVAYTAWRLFAVRFGWDSARRFAVPGPIGIGVFALGLAAASFVLRTQIAIGQSEWGFPSLAYLPQYLSFFTLGVLAQRGDWFGQLSPSSAAVGFLGAAASAVLLFPLAFSGDFASLELSPALADAMGDGHWQSAVYAVWDSVFAVGLCVTLVVLLRSLSNAQGRLGRYLAAHSYAVFVIHIPIVVLLGVLFRNVDMEHLLKFAMVGAIAVPTCFGVAWLVRKIPMSSRIL